MQRDGKFHLLEATIDGIHSALQKREITCDALIRLYFKRIKTYHGHCVKYDKNGDGISPDYDLLMPSGKGVYLGVVSVIPNAGKANAIQSVNLRPANGFNKLKSRLLEQKYNVLLGVESADERAVTKL